MINDNEYDNRCFKNGLENLIKCKLIFETDKPNIYKYNQDYF